MKLLRMLVLLPAIGLGGCATFLDKNLPQEAVSAAEAPRPALAEAPGAWVIIRYPAAFTPEAEARAKGIWSKWVGRYTTADEIESLDWMGTARPMMLPTKDGIPLTLAKSTYWVFELRDALLRRLPAGRVLLHPDVVTIDANGNFRYASEQALHPSVLLVDFMAPVGAYRAGKGTTVGEGISFNFAVRTAAAASPKTGGALVETAVRPLPLARAADPQHQGLYAAAGRDVTDYLNVTARPDGSFEPPQDRSWPPQPDRMTVLPVVWHRMDSDALRSWLKTTNPDPRRSPAAEFLRGYANVVVALLNRLDANKALNADLAAYVEQFDAPLASRIRSGSAEPADARKLALVGRLLEIERRFLTLQDDNGLKAIYQGTFGDGMRKMILEEVNYFERQRSFTFAQSLMAIGAGLASLSTQMAAGGAMTVGAFQPHLQFLTQHSTASKQFGETQSVALAERGTSLVEFTVDVGDTEEKIRAGSLPELRAESTRVYRRLFGG